LIREPTSTGTHPSSAGVVQLPGVARGCLCEREVKHVTSRRNMLFKSAGTTRGKVTRARGQTTALGLQHPVALFSYKNVVDGLRWV